MTNSGFSRDEPKLTPDPLRRLRVLLLPACAAQVALAVLTAVVVPGLDLPGSAGIGLIAGEAALAAGLVSLLIALRRRARLAALAVRSASTTRTGGRV